MKVYLLYFQMRYEDEKEIVGVFTTENKLNEYKESLINSKKSCCQYYKSGTWFEEISELNPMIIKLMGE